MNHARRPPAPGWNHVHPFELGLGLSHGRRRPPAIRVSGASLGRPELGRRHGPDFIVAGFSKCGSSTLSSLLAAHPEIDFCRGKESNFFLWDITQGWEWYERLFSRPRQAGLLRGDGSVFYSAAAWERTASEWMHRCVPDVKLIWIARDPLRRLESSYREAHHSGHFFGFHAPYAIGELARTAPNFIADSLYWQRLGHYLATFPRAHMHLLFLEDLARDPAAELRRLWEFLGVDADARFPVTTATPVNEGGRKLRDSRLLRRLRTSPITGPVVRRLPPAWLDRAGRLLGLRLPFTRPVAWRAADLQWTQDRLRDDARQFLDHAGKPADFWPWVGGGAAPPGVAT